MASRDMSDCVPELREKELLMRQAAALVGIRYIITCTARSHQEQLALFAQGRKPVEEVNRLRVAVKLPPITREKNRVVTWTIDSMHIVGNGRVLSRAFDVAILKEGTKVPHWQIKVDTDNDGIADYMELALIGQDLGLRAGGLWKTPDYPHFEI